MSQTRAQIRVRPGMSRARRAARSAIVRQYQLCRWRGRPLPCNVGPKPTGPSVPPPCQLIREREQLLCPAKLMDRSARSEEHTSELQSHLNLVCRLLLEKKN